VHTSAVSTQAVWWDFDPDYGDPEPPVGSRNYAVDNGSKDYALLSSELKNGVRYYNWGFGGDPSTLTVNGATLFKNFVFCIVNKVD